jgi:hypothetical protein
MVTQQLIKRLARGPLHVAVIVLAALWMIPTVGLLVS